MKLTNHQPTPSINTKVRYEVRIISNATFDGLFIDWVVAVYLATVIQRRRRGAEEMKDALEL